MSNIFLTIYTKEHGKQEFTLEGWYNFGFSDVFLHRLGGPAWIFYHKDGTIASEYFYINDKLHRENGPAEIFYREDGTVRSEYYHINGKLDREDGPAEIYYNEDGTIKSERYYIKGQPYKKNEYWKEINRSNVLKMME